MNLQLRMTNLFVIILLVVLIGFIHNQPASANSNATIDIGDYVQFGTYNGDPILWRVIHKYGDGKPLLLSDRILALRAYDSAGSYYPVGSDRAKFGSNFYHDSNLRQWLNSSSANTGANLLDWTQNNPSSANVWSGHNAYVNDSGFLSADNFTSTERGLMVPLTHSVLLANADSAQKDGGFVAHTMNTNISNSVQNYDTGAFYKFANDQVFLLSVKQLKEYVYDNAALLGDGYHLAKPTAKAVSLSSFKDSNFLSSNQNWSYWLNTPFASFSYIVRTVDRTGKVDNGAAFGGAVGVRPAVQLDNNSSLVVTGNGSANQPYVINRNQVYVPDNEPPSAPIGLGASNIKTTGFDLTWTASTDNQAVSGYDIYLNDVLHATVKGSTSFSFTGLSDNTEYRVKIQAKDGAQNVSSFSSVYLVNSLDGTAPSRPTGLQASSVTASSVQLSWNASTDNVAVTGYEVFMDGSSIGTTSTTDFLASGLSGLTSYQFSVVAFDGSNLKSAESSKLRVDTLDGNPPPAPTGLQGTEIGVGGFKLKWDSVNDDGGPVNYEVYLGDTKLATVSGTTYVFTGLSDYTSYKVKVRAVDQAGNWSSFSQLIDVLTLDGTAPNPPSGLKTDGVTASSVSLSWNAPTDNVAVTKYEVYMNGTLLESTSQTSYQVLGLSGLTLYQFTVRALDSSNLKSAASSILSVTTTDGSPPTAPGGITVSQLTSNSFKVSWLPSSDDGGVSEYEVYLGGSLVSVVAATTHTFSGLAEYTEYQVSIKAIDLSGNKSTTSSNATVRTLDVTSPTKPEELVYSELSKNGFKVSWTASTDNAGVANYKVYVDGVLAATVNGTNHTFTGMAEYKSNIITIRAVDAAGNQSAWSQALIVRTLDGTPPTMPTGLKSANVTASGFSVNWTASTDNAAVVGYEVFRSGTLVATVNGTNYTFTGLTSNTDYSVVVRARDAAGNLSLLSPPITVRTLDGTAPTVPSGLQSSAVTGSGFSVTWLSSTDNIGVTGYEVYRNGNLITTTSTTSYTFTGLAEYSLHEVTIRAKDAAGNVSENSALLTVRTLDVTAPTPPSALTTSNLTGTGFVLNWTASTDNVGVARYEVYRNNVFVANVTGTSYTFSNLSQGSTHIVALRARDATNNLSPYSLSVTVRTLDQTAPSAPTKLALSSITESSLTLSWSASTDNIGVAGYEVYRNGTLVGTTKNTKMDIKGIIDYGLQTLTVFAFDAAGNKSAVSASVSTVPTVKLKGQKVFVNFREVVFNKGLEPRVISGTTMVANKPYLEAFGLKVGWDQIAKTITGTRTGFAIRYTLGSQTALVNGTSKPLPATPVLVSGTVMIPLSFTAKELGYTIVTLK